jgi:hypothetical protein
MRSPYEVLGITSTATPEQAKKAYYALAKQYHPDVNRSPDATARMKEINTAWDQIKSGKSNGYAPSYSDYYRQQASDFERRMQEFEEAVRRASESLNKQHTEEKSKRERERRDPNEESAWFKEKKANGTWTTEERWGHWEYEDGQPRWTPFTEEEDLPNPGEYTPFPVTGTLKEKIKWACANPEKMTDSMFLALKTGGVDEFSHMSWGMLSSRISPEDLNTILHVFSTSGHHIKAMRWMCRGLPVGLAMRKVQVDARHYTGSYA